MNEQVISYIEYGKLIKDLCNLIRREYSGIYGIPRGGLPIAVHLSHHLHLPMLRSYDRIDDYTLIVDDVADTGETLKWYTNDIATLFYKPSSIVKPMYYVEITSKWIVFPWEVL